MRMISCLLVWRLDEVHGIGVSSSWARSFFHLVDQCWWMNFSMWEKRSELERSNHLNMIDSRAASLAILSTFSLSGIPFVPRSPDEGSSCTCYKEDVYTRRTWDWEAVRGEVTLGAMKISEINKRGWVDGKGEVDKIRWRQWKMSWSPVTYTEA